MPEVTVWLSPERAADGHHEIAHAKFRGPADGNGLQVVSPHLDDCDVAVLIGAHQGCFHGPAVVGGDGDLVGPVDDMVVRENVAVGGIDDDPGTEAAALPFARAEEPAEERILHQGVIRGPDPGSGGDVHHRREDIFQHRRQAGQGLAIHPGGQQGVGGAGQPEKEKKAGTEKGARDSGQHGSVLQG